MAVLIKLRFSLPALIFISASKRQIQLNNGIHINTFGEGFIFWGLITGCLFLFTGRWDYH